MAAIIKRELSSYFNSALGFIILAVFFFFSGLFFWYTVNHDSSSLSYVFSSMITIIVFLIPLMTMKSFAEEKRQKTDQALLTAPVSLVGIVMGKFISSIILFALCNSIFIVYIIFIAIFTAPDWIIFLTTLLGFLLMGAALISIGLFISTLTESQAVAAIFSVAAGLLILMLDSFASGVNIGFIKEALYSVSFYRHFYPFTYGVITLSGVVFFTTVTALFLFLCIRVLEKRRWS